MDISGKPPAFNPEYVDEGASRQQCHVREGRAIGATPAGPSNADADDEDSTPAFRSGWTTTPKVPKFQSFVPATEPRETAAQIKRRRGESESGDASDRQRTPRLEKEEEEVARREAERSATEVAGSSRSEAEAEGPAAVTAAVDNLGFVRENESFQRLTVDESQAVPPGLADSRRGDGTGGRSSLALQVGGAAVAGAVAGLAVSGAAVGAVAAGGAAAYTAAKSSGAAGDAARRTGERVAAAGDRAREVDAKHGISRKTKKVAHSAVRKAREVDERHGLVGKSKGVARSVATAARGVDEKHRVAEKTKGAALATTKKVASGVKFISKSMAAGKKSADDVVPAS